MPTTAPRLTHIPDLLEEHVEEVEFLWALREAALTSPRHTLRELVDLDERIEAHVQGILAVGARALPLLDERLAAEEAPAVFAAAYPMLRLGPESAAQAVEAFSGAAAGRLDGLTRALSFGPAGALLPEVRSLLLSAGAPVAAAAAEVLAFHRAYGSSPGRLLLLVRDEAPAVRRHAWRVSGYLGVPLEPKLYAAAMRDEDAGVRQAALLAAAWSRVPGALALARQLAEAPTPDNLEQLHLLAVLGTTQDLARVGAIVRSGQLGPGRFRVAGSFGHPSLVELLLAGIGDPDSNVAVPAAQAFARMTGQNIDSGDRAKRPPPGGAGPDEFEAEFQEEVALPSPELARKHWAEVKPRFAQATRISQGFDLTRGASLEVLAQLDMESRWEACLRSRFEGVWAGSAADLEAYPMARLTVASA